jgi:hypothetical protein
VIGNGTAGSGGQNQVGIDFTGNATGSIVGVTATDNAPSGKTQLYGFEADNCAAATLIGNRMDGNGTSSINENQVSGTPKSIIENIINQGSCSISSSTGCNVTFSTAGNLRSFNVTPVSRLRLTT